MATNIVWHQHEVNKKTRAQQLKQKPRVIWLTGLSGSGKSTLANLLEKKLHDQGTHTYLLDGDNIRHGLCGDLGFTDKERVENIRRISEVARLFVDAGTVVLTAFISPFQTDRDFCRKLVDDGEFIEVFVDVPLDVCEQRDPKGLYKKARNGEIKDFTGIDSTYEAPVNPEVHLSYQDEAAEDTAERLYQLLTEKGLI